MRLLPLVVVLLFFVIHGRASSHSEAPGTAKTPNADLTDFYMFRSYESGRSGFLTFIMNIYPLQNPFGGPNYFSFSDSHFFEINVDNNGDGVEDMIFQFYYGNQLGGSPTTVLDPDTDDCPSVPYNKTMNSGITLAIGTGTNLKNIAVPLKFVGQLGVGNTAALNWFESYQINFIQGSRTSNVTTPINKAGSPSTTTFTKPLDYAGEKTFGNAAAYEAYARSYIYSIDVPGCSTSGSRVFVGQRKESFHISLGKIFDLINLNPVPGTPSSIAECDSNNDLANLNIGSFVLEVPIACVATGGTDTIGAWATVRKLVHAGGGHVPGPQVGRLGNPLVNELFIGLIDKNNFNMGVPTGDAAFADYVTHPTLPAIIDLLFRAAVNSSTNIAPSNIPRTDLVTTFLQGLPGLNQPPNVVTCEQMRLNTSIPATPQATQSPFGVIGGDSAGFPNGRRPGDDVVDIALRVAMGRLCHIAGLNLCTAADAPVGAVDLTDGAPQNSSQFDNAFPYLTTPNPGSTTNPNPTVCAGGCPSSASSILPYFAAIVFIVLATFLFA